MRLSDILSTLSLNVQDYIVARNLQRDDLLKQLGGSAQMQQQQVPMGGYNPQAQNPNMYMQPMQPGMFQPGQQTAYPQQQQQFNYGLYNPGQPGQQQ